MTPGSPVLAIVKDLFFVARIRETARLAGVPLTFARTPEEITTGLTARPRFALPQFVLTRGLSSRTERNARWDVNRESLALSL